MKKVVIAIADVGGGHLAPAVALKHAFEKSKNDYQVEIIDLLKLLDTPPFNTSEHSYKLVTENWTLEHINNMLFYSANYFLPVWEHLIWNWTLAKAVPIIDDLDADIIISNHTIVTAIIKGVKKAKLNFVHIAQITDAKEFFRTCVDTTADAVIAPTREAKEICTKYGVLPEKIIYPYFPLKPSLQKYRPKETVLKEIGFSTDKPVILFTAGGLGIEGLTKAVDKLAAHSEWQTIVLAGKVKTAEDKLRKKYGHLKHVKIFGFVNNIQDYLHAADIVVGKPGMSTVMESEAFVKKTILTHPVAVQEKGNVEYALRSPLFKFVDRDWNKLPDLINAHLLTKIPQDYAPRQDFAGAEKIVAAITQRFGHKS